MVDCEIIPRTMNHRISPHMTIRVSFMITGEVAANLVRFTAVAASGAYREFSLSGNFTKTVMIDDVELQADPQSEEATENVPPLPQGVDCAITFIHFDDGSSWGAPSP